MSTLDKLKTFILKQNDSKYPKQLLALDQASGLKNAPKKLYLKGNPEALTAQPNFAIVGTRKISKSGYELGLKIAQELAELGFTIVSGLAEGGDTAAHQGALNRVYEAAIKENRSPTVAVLGTSLEEDYLYPKSNLNLARQIVESGGALVSEYEAATHGSKITFPARNRIIAGLSLGVLVLECQLKSGAMITARVAQKLGRPVFAVPGSPFHHNAQGPNWLIQNGAYLTQRTEDIIKTLTKHYPRIIARTQGPAAPKTTKAAPKQPKTPEQKKILEALTAEPLHIDKLQEKTKLNPSELNQVLTEMELEDLIKEVGPKIYASNS